MNTAHAHSASLAWQALLAMPRDDDDIATFALTLHMLQHHAPHFFAAHVGEAVLPAAMARLDDISTDFGSGDDWNAVQAQLDALYLRHIRGLRVPAFDVVGLRAAIVQMAAMSPVGGWLLAELARPLGVVVDVGDAVDDDVLECYRSTHVVLLAGQYLQRAADVSSSTVAQIVAAGDMAFDRSRWDLLAECLFCLQTLNVPYESAWVLALRGAQHSDGVVVEDASPEQRLHCTAAALVAFAGAAERC
jgi:D-amino peptidase